MHVTYVYKRDGELKPFKSEKITIAICKSMEAVQQGSREDAEQITNSVLDVLENIKLTDTKYIPSIEGIQNIVEQKLMQSDFLDVAKAYILYRNEQELKRKKNVFEKRVFLKPYEYPDMLEYVDAIRHSYWIHTEFNFTSDIHDFKTRLSLPEQEAIKRTMLAISQIEVSVKTFWGNVHNKMPKPEIGSVGATFAESEVRHHDAYSHLLEILGLNDEFEKLADNPTIMKRVRYLESALKHANSENNQEYAESILLFALFIEHVSLFSQFLVIMSFNKHKNVLKGISNVVEATSKEEQIHGNFGTDLIQIIKQENPEWFDDNHAQAVKSLCKQAYKAEAEIVDWIFEKGEIDFLPKEQIKEFMKNRFNNSLQGIGIEKVFSVDEVILERTEWFDDEIIGTKHGDFFVKRSINYNKRSKSITSDDLF
jgi:ribonucleoside-diphosphate reductase beta chain